MSSRRLAGLETEYAVRYHPEPGTERPDHELIYDALVRAIGQQVAVVPARRVDPRRRVFLANGAALCYEFLPTGMQVGLVEGATPECRSPQQLLLYQRATEELLRRALPVARAELAERGYRGELGLIKNCRDVDGQVYGAQENYEVDFARGRRLWLWRLGLLLLLPAVIFSALSQLAMLMLYLPWVVLRLVLARQEEPAASELQRLERVAQALAWPALSGILWMARRLGYRELRHGITAFLVSRCLISGAGTVEEDGSFGLSEKGPSMRSLMRRTIRPAERSIYEIGHLAKPVLAAPLEPRLGSYRRLFRQRQRLQLGLSDSNIADVAEALKIGSTRMVVDLAQAGALADAPQLDDPVAAVHTLCRDPTGQATVPTDRGPMTALELQRYYVERARQWMEAQATVDLDDQQLVQLWAEVLEQLGTDPSPLVGRLDWVTKRYLLEATAADAPHAVRKRVDIGYHDLSGGYFDELAEAVQAPRLVRPEELERALREPPSDSPARLRGELIEHYADHGDIAVSWDSLRIGGPVRGRVYRLDDYRTRDRLLGPEDGSPPSTR